MANLILILGVPCAFALMANMVFVGKEEKSTIGSWFKGSLATFGLFRIVFFI